MISDSVLLYPLDKSHGVQCLFMYVCYILHYNQPHQSRAAAENNAGWCGVGWWATSSTEPHRSWAAAENYAGWGGEGGGPRAAQGQSQAVAKSHDARNRVGWERVILQRQL